MTTHITVTSKFANVFLYLHKIRGSVKRERLGLAFRHLSHVLLQNEFDAVLKWRVFWVRSHTFFS